MSRRSLIALAFLCTALAALVAGCGGGGGGDSASTPSSPGPQAQAPKRPLCTITMGPSEELTSTLAQAQPGAVLCLRDGNYPETAVPAEATDKARTVIIQPAPNAKPTFTGELRFEGARNIKVDGISFGSGLSFYPEAENIEVVNDNLTGIGGIYFDGDEKTGGSCRHVLIEGNTIHEINYTGPQDGYQGYGIKSVGVQSDFTVRDNTIQSVAADYIQTDVAVDWTVEGNTFLGPTLVGTHPQEHQDLWQDYAGGRNMVFRDNIARHTGTSESLLFQLTYPHDSFEDVKVENNLFDHDTAGYTIQIYQIDGFTFTDNTVVGSHFGSVFRNDEEFPPGSGYKVEHNVFAETTAGHDLGVENGVENWGSFAYNVTGDNSAFGPHSVPNWKPRWGNEEDYPAVGLPISAGFKAPSS